jgi:hypothetical protein
MNNLDSNTKALIFSMLFCTVILSVMLFVFAPRNCEITYEQ